MNLPETYSKLDRLLQKKEKYFTHLGKTLSVIDETVEKKRENVAMLSNRISKLKENRKQTLQKIRLTEKNTIIYNVNIDKINREISRLFTDARKVKESYDTLLHGPVSEIMSHTEDLPRENPFGKNVVCKDDKDGAVDTIDDNTVTLIDLEKKSFLRSIDVLFQQYEEEIDRLNIEKKAFSEKLEKLKLKLGNVTQKKELFYTIQRTYREELSQMRLQIQKEHEDLKKIELLLNEMVSRIKFSSRLNEKARPLFSL
ncbi:MAG: hypothetical protein ACE5FU_08525 [Nitrospinota bacterium]